MVKCRPFEYSFTQSGKYDPRQWNDDCPRLGESLTLRGRALTLCGFTLLVQMVLTALSLTPFLLISSLCDSSFQIGNDLDSIFFSDSVDSTFLFFSPVPSVRTAHTAHPVRTHFDTRGTTAARALDPGDSRRSTTSLVCRSPTGPLHPTSVPLSPP